MKNRALSSFVLIILSTTVGCSSLIFGNIKPFEEKSQRYSIMDISKDNPSWIKLSSAEKKAEHGQSHDTLGEDSSDMSFVSKETGSTISLNSACKNYSASDKKPTLRKLTDELLVGTLTGQSPSSREENIMLVQNISSLQTITQGVLNGRDFVIETVVLQVGNCIYDLIFVARAEKFKRDEKYFSRFVSSLRFK